MANKKAAWRVPLKTPERKAAQPWRVPMKRSAKDKSFDDGLAALNALPLYPAGMTPSKPVKKSKAPQDWAKGLSLGGSKRPAVRDVMAADKQALRSPPTEQEQWDAYNQYELLKDAPTGEISNPGYRGLADRTFDALDSVGVDAAPLRTIDNNFIGLGPAERAAARLGKAWRGAGDFSGWDAADVALTLPGFGMVGKLAAKPAKALLRGAEHLTPKAVRTGLRRAGEALTRVEPLVDRPDYIRSAEGPFLNIRRADLEPQTNPAIASARNLGEMRPALRDPATNPALRMANEEALRVRGAPLSPDGPMPVTSLQRQAGMGRAFQEAASENPAYQQAVFDRYGEMFPQVVEGAKAQNYDQLREAAYQQLGKEVTQQFDQLPVSMRYHEGPGEYATPSDMMRDAVGRGNLNVFSGGDPHEFLSKIDPQTGLSQNEMFRAVHDYIGHGATGATFRPGGEEIAYAAHSGTMSPLAQLALLAETRGQNSFVNYSPVNADLISKMNDVRAQIYEKGTAEGLKLSRDFPYWMDRGLNNALDLPPVSDLQAQLRELGSRFEYAPQKAVLMPPEYMDPLSPGGTPDWLRDVYSPEGASARGVHISRSEGLTGTDPSFFGTGHRGEEYRGTKGVGPDRTYFYTGPEGTVVPEPVVMGNGDRYAYESPLSGLYDVDQDPQGLRALAEAYNLPARRSTLPEMLTFGDNAKGAPNLGNRSALPDMERLVRDYGYSGYLSGAGKQRAAAVYDPVENLRAIIRGDKGYAAGGRVKSETPCGCS